MCLAQLLVGIRKLRSWRVLLQRSQRVSHTHDLNGLLSRLSFKSIGKRRLLLPSEMNVYCARKEEQTNLAFAVKPVLSMHKNKPHVFFQSQRNMIYSKAVWNTRFHYQFSVHLQYFEVREQFTSSWRHPAPKIPAVRFVYKVISTKELTDKYESYR